MKILRNLFVLAAAAIFYLTISGGDCGTDNDPAPQNGVAPPQNVILSVDADSTGNSFAEVKWDASADHNKPEFKGYRVKTYRLTPPGINSVLFEDVDVGKTGIHVINNISRDTTRYRTYITAVLNDGKQSDSIGTVIYSGVYHRTDGELIEYFPDNQYESGYGWDPSTGTGMSYTYTQDNASLIDLHLRASNDSLYFYSPDVFDLENANRTLIEFIGFGEEAFDLTELNEPVGIKAETLEDGVYLLKTAQDYYIKIWVRTLINIIEPFPHKGIHFDYKIQPAKGLRIVKR